MRPIIFIAALAWSGAAVAETVPASSPRWVFEGEEHRVETYLGREAIYLRNAAANIADANFDTGVIAFDIAADRARGFQGVAFRGQDAGNYEHFYLRPHQSGNPDANQYTPVINGMTGWQIYSGAEYSAPTRYRFGEWMHVRLEVAADSVRVFIDSETPSVVIPDLKRDRQAGFLALLGSFAGVHFSNFSFTSGEVASAPPAPVREPDAGEVRNWMVSAAMRQDDAFAAAARNRLAEISWTPLAVESNGIANLARVAVRSDERPGTLARISARSDRARIVRLRFGFSDRVRLYLNGALLYEGEDVQASRDYRFLGTVGLYDSVYLPLRRGDNEIVLAVSEGAGGWAAAAAFADMTGLTLVP